MKFYVYAYSGSYPTSTDSLLEVITGETISECESQWSEKYGDPDYSYATYTPWG